MPVIYPQLDGVKINEDRSLPRALIQAVRKAYDYIADLSGAGIGAVLTGIEKIVFAGATPPATIAAPAGALTITSGDTNQNIVLTPSGTGLVRLSSGINIPNATSSYAIFDSSGVSRTILIMDAANPDILHFRNNQRGTGGPIVVETKTGAGETARFSISGGFSLGSTTDPGAGNFLLQGNLVAHGTVTTYNNIATVGHGVPALYGFGRVTAQTGAVGTLVTYTVGASDGTFVISANVLITTSTTFNFTVNCTYTDENGTTQTMLLPFMSVSGGLSIHSTIANTAGAVVHIGFPLHIRAKASTAITISTTGTFTSVVYNVEGQITQLA